MRDIKLIIIHCSATKEGKDFTAADINEWHRLRGFHDPMTGIHCGYHYVIRLDGTIETGRPEESQGAHCYGYNRESIGICYIGGLDANGKAKDTRTPAQKSSLTALIRELKTRYPNAKVHGHREFARKDCPCFNANEEYCWAN